jgi:hypothetical protein
MEEILRQLALWMYTTPVSHFVNTAPWAWSLLEIAHFTGLAVMAGAIGVFDLRLLGLAKGLTPAALHRLIVWGVGGFALNACSGALFLFGAPEQYFFNAAFRAKVVLFALMAANVAAFYAFAYPRVNAMTAGEDAPLRAKIIAGVSLFALAGIMLAGRMLTFFRPMPDVLG